MSRIPGTNTPFEAVTDACPTHIPSPPRASRMFALAALCIPLALSVTVLGATSAAAITRNEVLARGQKWVDSPVSYSQTKNHAGYRTDCSGYVSMCWGTGTSWSTRSFGTVSRRVAVSQLKPGDALLKKGYHVRLFYGWIDDAHTQYASFESSNGKVAECRIHSIAEDLEFGYVPVRYNRVTDSPMPRNVLQNGSFNLWGSSWGNRADQPIFWQAGRSRWQTLAMRRQDTYRSTRNSLQLVNPSVDPASYTELSQSAPVIPNAWYRLSAYAKTDFDPRGLELRLAYLDAAGQPVAETVTTGDASGVNGASFRRMSVLLATPPGAVKALVTVRLAGAITTSTAGIPVPGTSATLDDFSLSRPQVSATIKTSAKTVRTGKTIRLSGTITPKSATAVRAVVYVQVPGKKWKKLSTARVYASGSAAAWKSTFKFKRGMRKGTYRFKTTVPSFPGYLGSTTSVVSVKLK